MNPYFDFSASPFRFVPRTKAKAEDVNARFDEVSYGFDLVDADFTARDLVLATKAPLASPAFTTSATLDGLPLATQAYAQSLAFAAVFPIVASDKGKVARVSAGGLGGWDDWWGQPTTLTVANNGATLALRKTYRFDSSGGAFSVNLPAGMVAGDWLKFSDTAGQCAVNNVSVLSNGNGNFRDGDSTLIFDVAYDSAELIKSGAGVIEQ